jgi:putative NADH-flavin reductase
MQVTIFGATGSIGKHLVNEVLESGNAVTAVVRDPSKLAVQHANLRVVVADVTIDDDRLRDAVTGSDAVMVALGDGIRGSVRSLGTRHIIAAMKEADARRLICQSTLGAGDSFANLNWLWRFIFRVPLRRAMADHLAQEQHVRDSGLDWTIVRPAAFTDGEKTGQYRHGFAGQAEGLTLKISRADVADFMMRQLRSLDYLRKTPALSY